MPTVSAIRGSFYWHLRDMESHRNTVPDYFAGVGSVRPEWCWPLMVGVVWRPACPVVVVGVSVIAGRTRACLTNVSGVVPDA